MQLFEKPFRRSRGSGNPVKDIVLLDSRFRGNDGEMVPFVADPRQHAVAELKVVPRTCSKKRFVDV
jgi:hypothetical protein